eukprot:CAMPEP_0205936954 /NCGR_PEP_ID=MMETSP1325-20131115/42820_1 /ASSEMBLY_ACC=CAM_ASM_000708 /TAXON_ID=236786 /ORGANISM="Florenciella sp., Strain RCC1007" /LENGTH=56 /DNA_ID=CAMNT_0053307165 /DNA_START=96 /DNA_END=266 /DNA_ORIENTATION=-
MINMVGVVMELAFVLGLAIAVVLDQVTNSVSRTSAFEGYLVSCRSLAPSERAPCDA